MTPQTTLARSSTPVDGWQLDRDLPAAVTFHPARAGTGVVFVRSDLRGFPEVACCVEHVTAWPRWSSLEHQGVEVHHTEHILAALAGLGVDNVRVEMNTDRIPVVSGGSCQAFCKALTAAELSPLPEPRSVLRLKRPIEWATDLDLPAGSSTSPPAQRRVLGRPAHGFSASYLFHVPAVPGLRPGVAEFAEGEDDFYGQLAGARTYYLRTEEQELSGLLSKARADYIVLDADSPQALVDEVARHKLVDFWGDLRLLGRPVWGSFTAFRTGHRFHHEFIRKLVREDCLEAIELSESQVSYDHH